MGLRRGLGGLCGACCSGSEDVLLGGGAPVPVPWRDASWEEQEVRCNKREAFMLPLLRSIDIDACCRSWRIHKPRFSMTGSSIATVRCWLSTAH